MLVFFVNKYNIGELTSATSKERMTLIMFSQVPHSLINEKFICQ